MPRLTIVIPTVNRSRLVVRAVDSALAQTYEDMEILVSDNGSTDDTREILDRYHDPRLTILHRKDTIPSYAHGNALLQMIRGDFVLFLSDDDYLEPRFAEAVMALIDSHPTVMFVYTGCWQHYAGVAVPTRSGPRLEHGIHFLEAYLAGGREPCFCALVSRTDGLRQIGAMPKDTICGDIFYWSKLAALGDVGCVPDLLSHYTAFREGGDNISGGTPVLEWTKELHSLYEEMISACERVPGRTQPVETLRKNAASRLARITADQFLWNALGGKRRLSLLHSLSRCLRILGSGDATLWIRVVAFVTLPTWFLRWLLRKRLLATARRRTTLLSQARS